MASDLNITTEAGLILSELSQPIPVLMHMSPESGLGLQHVSQTQEQVWGNRALELMSEMWAVPVDLQCTRCVCVCVCVYRHLQYICLYICLYIYVCVCVCVCVSV